MHKDDFQRRPAWLPLHLYIPEASLALDSDSTGRHGGQHARSVSAFDIRTSEKTASEILAVWPARSTHVSGMQSLSQGRCTALGKQSLSHATPTVRRTSAGLRRIYATTAGLEIDPKYGRAMQGSRCLVEVLEQTNKHRHAWVWRWIRKLTCTHLSFTFPPWKAHTNVQMLEQQGDCPHTQPSWYTICFLSHVTFPCLHYVGHTWTSLSSVDNV